MAKKTKTELSFLENLLADIITSPLKNEQKAVLIYALTKGVFSFELYDWYLQLLSQYGASIDENIAALEQKRNVLHQDVLKSGQELSNASLEACKEIQALATHIERKTEHHVEQLGHKAGESALQAIRKKLKSSKS